MRERRTITEHWERVIAPLASEDTSRWFERAQAAADLLQGARSVLDLGCWNMRLETLLEPGVRYIPADVAKRDDRTIVVDLNTDAPPEVDAEAVALIGVLEYLYDADVLMADLADLYSLAVVTYTRSGTRVENRRSRFWVNDYTLPDMERMFDQAGWDVVETRPVSGQQIWKLRSRFGDRRYS